jgi:hypothetical protein
VRVDTQGDGRRYKLTATTQGAPHGVVWQAELPVLPAGEWVRVDVPWAQFAASWRGQSVRAEPLTGASLHTLGLMASKFAADSGLTANFTPGPFRLLLRSVCAYR